MSSNIFFSKIVPFLRCWKIQCSRTWEGTGDEIERAHFTLGT